ncbi:MAG: zf-HC2 domain-containing protein [Pyrinomonadaceae bacterium]
MNCKQLEELLPLYAGRDLDEKRARLVGEHLQICSACARVAGEYRGAFELTQHFAPPVFSDHVYASVRRQVMQQIEDEPAAPLLPQLLATWFRPRMAWAAASALIIALGFFALYLVVNRDADVRPVAENNPTVDRTQPNAESMATPRTTDPVSPPSPVKPAVEKRRHIHRFVNRSLLVAAKAPNSSRAADNSPKLRDPEAANSLPSDDSVPGKTPLRVEMQTKDPNIRIIWFSQSNSKPALPNSKGI